MTTYRSAESIARDMVGSSVRKMYEDRTERFVELDEAKTEHIMTFTCPKCKAEPNKRCTLMTGHWKGKMASSWHNERAAEANKNPPKIAEEIIEEAPEQIDELSRDTLKSYQKKAMVGTGKALSDRAKAADKVDAARKSGDKDAEHASRKEFDKADHTYVKRQDGEKKARKRLETGHRVTKEEVEEIPDVIMDVIENQLETVGYSQLDELSKKTLANYVMDASDDRSRHAAKGENAALKGKHKESDKHFRKDYKRGAGIAKAVQKLTKEEYDELNELSKGTLDSYKSKAEKDFPKHEYVKNHTSETQRKAGNRNKGIERATRRTTGHVHEDAEQIDELSKHTLKSYIKTAAYGAAREGHMAGAGNNKKFRDQHLHKAKKRAEGIGRAAEKLAREEVEIIDEATVSTKKHSWGTMKVVHDGAHQSFPLHPEHQKAIGALKHGETANLKLETGNKVTATRHEDSVHLSQTGSNRKVSVKHSDIAEDFEQNASAVTEVVYTDAETCNDDTSINKIKEVVENIMATRGRPPKDPVKYAAYLREKNAGRPEDDQIEGPRPSVYQLQKGCDSPTGGVITIGEDTRHYPRSMCRSALSQLRGGLKPDEKLELEKKMFESHEAFIAYTRPG